MNLEQEKRQVAQAQKDPRAFAEIYDKYYPKIFGYLLKRTADVQVAQDLASETFFKALHKLWQFRWRNIPFSAWLYKIATNELRQYYRKSKNLSLDQMMKVGFDPASEENLESEISEAQE
ncbi:MAG TPA: sigma factor, partial [Candidatus Paceibacterota bacterium]|nr:sigma factor [Candidatus Paceibacterota bacterium]